MDAHNLEEEKTSSTENKKSKASLKKALSIFSYLGPYKLLFGIGFLILVISSALTMAFPYMIKLLISAARGEGVWNHNQIAIGLFVLLFLQGIFSFLRIFTFAQVTQRAMANIRSDIFYHLVSLPVSFFEKKRIGELTSRITADVEKLETVMATSLAEFLRQIITLISGIVLIFVFFPSLALFMLVIFPIVVVFAMSFGKFIRRMARDTRDQLAQTNNIVDETLHSIQVVKAFTNEIFELNKYKAAIGTVMKTALKTATYRGMLASFIVLVVFGAIVAVIWYGVGLMIEGEIMVEDLIAFVLYTGFIGGAAGGLGNLYSEIEKAIGSTERILEILDEEMEYDPASTPTGPVPTQGEVVFDDVVFSYPTRTELEVLRGVSLKVPQGKKVALVGHSGAGKSTIAQLIQNFYELDSGLITIDGRPISEYALHNLRGNIGVVPQDVILFGGSIYDNIRYGKPEAGPEAIRLAAEKANALEFIDRFPEGMETIVGDRGIRLSGGQKQRIAIARAILRDPCILILDEATSSLDAESEKVVQDALEILMENRTTIIIAHRLATVQNADCIYVLDKGKIAESGTHDELLQVQDGIYENLVKLQFEKNMIRKD